MIYFLTDILLIIAGWLVYAFNGLTPAISYRSMLNLHCRTNGLSSNLIYFITKLFSRKKVFKSNSVKNSLMSNVSQAQRDKMLYDLREFGYCICPTTLNAQTCQNLISFASNTYANPWDSEGLIHEPMQFDKSISGYAKLQFEKNDLAGNSDIQNLMADSSILSFVQDYFKVQPIIDCINMWWSFPASCASDEIAQTFHFDFDRVKWLKMFIYLTDVDKNSGPHVFVRNSHKSEARRAELLSRGYVRIADEDIEKIYTHNEINELYGKVGTVLFVDTSGFHKGKVPKNRERLVFEMQFSVSLLGANYPNIKLGTFVQPALREMMQGYPHIYSLFTH